MQKHDFKRCYTSVTKPRLNITFSRRYPLIRKCFRTSYSHTLGIEENGQENRKFIGVLIKVEYRILADSWQHIENTELQHTRKSEENI